MSVNSITLIIMMTHQMPAVSAGKHNKLKLSADRGVVKKWRADEASKAAIVHSFTKTGCAVTVDGSGWGAIKPERVQVPFVNCTRWLMLHTVH